MLELPTLQRLIDPLLPGLLGVRLIETGPERVLAEMDVRPELCTAGAQQRRGQAVRGGDADPADAGAAGDRGAAGYSSSAVCTVTTTVCA